MLSPETRAVAMEMLRPPPGYLLDQAVLTSYSLDLEVLLALPLAVLAQSDQGLTELLEDPLLLLEAIREAGGRIHVFVDHAGIAIPSVTRPLYAVLEEMVHPVKAPNGGVFHPKVWVARFHSEQAPPVFRVSVSSRNLTFDRSWDIALTTESSAEAGEPLAESKPLSDLLGALPGMAVHGLGEAVVSNLSHLAQQIARCVFPAPDGFASPVSFQVFGLAAGLRRVWKPGQVASNLLAIAPFVNRTGLDALANVSTGERTLVSRQEALDELSEQAISAWQTVMVLSDDAIDEPEDQISARPSGLHAKMMALEHGNRVSWYVGSANLTEAAFTGRNVEMLVSMTGKRGRTGVRQGIGIEDFKEAGFPRLCKLYQRRPLKPQDAQLKHARALLEQARSTLLESDLKVICQPLDNGWRWILDGNVSLPDGVSVRVWPVSLSEDQGNDLLPSIQWQLPMAKLTAFVAFRLSAEVSVDDIRLAVKLPSEGIPEGRVAHVLRTLIDSPQRFLQFLRALLGGLEGLSDWAQGDKMASMNRKWIAGLGAETLLEDLVRIASRDPGRLEPVRRLIEELRSSPEGASIVPDDLYQIWQVVDAVVSEQVVHKQGVQR